MLTGGGPSAKTAREQLVGSWTLVSLTAGAGADQTLPYGPNPKGTMMVDANGRFSITVLRYDLPKFASNNRDTGTPDENKAIVQGSITYFGTYSVNEADGTLTLHIERSSFPNWNGTDQKRTIASLTAEELRYTNPAASVGGTAELVWK